MAGALVCGRAAAHQKVQHRPDDWKQRRRRGKLWLPYGFHVSIHAAHGNQRGKATHHERDGKAGEQSFPVDSFHMGNNLSFRFLPLFYAIGQRLIRQTA